MRDPAIVIYVPSPPSLNGLWATTAKGRVRSSKYRSWATTAGWEVKRQVVGMPMVRVRFDAEVLVPISRRDTDNWAKALFDLLEDVGVIANDGNLNKVSIEPMQRTDCCVALTLRPDLGDVRPPVVRRYKPARVMPDRPSAAKLKAVAALRARVPF